jgi:proline iminopeptidase
MLTQKILAPQMDPKITKQFTGYEIIMNIDNPTVNYFLNIIHEHVLRMPTRNGQNPSTAVSSTLILMYVYMQGHSEFGITGNAKNGM